MGPSHDLNHCPELLSMLQRQARGVAPPWHEWQFVAHLVGCRTCRVVYAPWIDALSQKLPTPQLDSEPVIASPWARRVRMAAVIVWLVSIVIAPPPVSHAQANDLLSHAIAYERAHVQTPTTATRKPPLRKRWIPAKRSATADAARTFRESEAWLARMFETHHLAWDDPLSPTRYQAWRTSRTRVSDRVEPIIGPHGEKWLAIRTATDEGAIAVAEMIVWRNSYEPLRQVLTFEGGGRLEIEAGGADESGSASADRERATDRVGQEARSLAAEIAHEPVAVAASIATLIDRDALDLTELDARLVLREAGLDLLGVRVSRARDGIHVEGRVHGRRTADTDRHRQALAKLSALPHVHVGMIATTTAAAVVPASALSRWRARTFGASAERATFLPALVARVGSVHQRLRTLGDLAERYPDDETAQALSPAARLKLRRLLDLHYLGVRADLAAIGERLSVLFGSQTRIHAAVKTPADWQERSTAGLAQAEALRLFVQELLMLDDLPSDNVEDTARAPHPVERTFGTLWDTVNGGPARPSPR